MDDMQAHRVGLSIVDRAATSTACRLVHRVGHLALQHGPHQVPRDGGCGVVLLPLDGGRQAQVVTLQDTREDNRSAALIPVKALMLTPAYTVQRLNLIHTR